jgi:hypothetical protein
MWASGDVLVNPGMPADYTEPGKVEFVMNILGFGLLRHCLLLLFLIDVKI